jgi:hypothetical protein
VVDDFVPIACVGDRIKENNPVVIMDAGRMNSCYQHDPEEGSNSGFVVIKPMSPHVAVRSA